MNFNQLFEEWNETLEVPLRRIRRGHHYFLMVARVLGKC